MTKPQQQYKLRRNGDQILVYCSEQSEGLPARVVWARPLTSPGGATCILHATKKEELLLLETIDDLDDISRNIVQEELQRRYFLPRITRVIKTKATFGNRYWEVETDCGRRQFLMKSPETNATWLSDDRCILRDTLGNCYEIKSLKELDSASRMKAETVL